MHNRTFEALSSPDGVLVSPGPGEIGAWKGLGAEKVQVQTLLNATTSSPFLARVNEGASCCEGAQRCEGSRLPRVRALFSRWQHFVADRLFLACQGPHTAIAPLSTCLPIHPYPGEPKESGISLQAVRELGPIMPLFGVCMGHQCIGEAFGGELGPGYWPYTSHSNHQQGQ